MIPLRLLPDSAGTTKRIPSILDPRKCMGVSSSTAEHNSKLEINEDTLYSHKRNKWLQAVETNAFSSATNDRADLFVVLSESGSCCRRL